MTAAELVERVEELARESRCAAEGAIKIFHEGRAIDIPCAIRLMEDARAAASLIERDIDRWRLLGGGR